MARSRMTLRVGKVGPDGVVAFGPRRVVEVEPDRVALRDDVFRYPPCACPRHRSGPDADLGRPAGRGARPARSVARWFVGWRP